MNTEKDIRRLNLLGIFHYVWAGLLALFICIGLFELAHYCLSTGQPFTMFSRVIYGLLIWSGLPAICLFISGRILRQRKGRMFGMIFTAIVCLLALWRVATALYLLSVTDSGELYYARLLAFEIIPIVVFVLLAILSIFTLITLNKKSVKELYTPPSTALPSNETV